MSSDVGVIAKRGEVLSGRVRPFATSVRNKKAEQNWIRYLNIVIVSYGLQDPFSRSLAKCWMDWELASQQPVFLDLFRAFYRTPIELKDA